MTLEERISLIADLARQRDEITRRLEDLLGGAPAKRERKALTCSICGSDQHTARTCPHKDKKPLEQSTPEPPRSFSALAGDTMN